MSDGRFDPRFDPAYQRGGDGQRAWDGPRDWDDPQPAALAESPRPPASERMVVTAEPEPEPEPDARRFNPFLIALAAVAVALVVAGLWMASRVSSGFSDQNQTQLDWALLQILMIGSPVTVLLGVATGVGILFVFAARWERAARDRRD